MSDEIGRRIETITTTVTPVVAFRAECVSPLTGETLTRLGESKKEAIARVHFALWEDATERGLTIQHIIEDKES